MSKRIQSFFQPIPAKKAKVEEVPENTPTSQHPSYPFPISHLPSHIDPLISPKNKPKSITNHPDLDLLYFQPFIPTPTARDLFYFLRNELPFYRVQYTIRRGTIETQINTPRFTTVFGVDSTAYFIPDSSNPQSLVDSKTNAPVPNDTYRYTPRPIPACLDALRRSVEAATNDASTYNFCLVNYYASGEDSITYHSDDERFLGPSPTIASISLGAKRDFLLKHKPPPPGSANTIDSSPLKYPLASGDMIIMRGPTQANWLHSIPKRRGGEATQGRINITFRKAVVPGGTNNYYNYNVGGGPVHRWNKAKGEMVESGNKTST